jgi:hypothetical protein
MAYDDLREQLRHRILIAVGWPGEPEPLHKLGIDVYDVAAALHGHDGVVQLDPDTYAPLGQPM